MLGIPFVLHKRERQMEEDVVETDYVVVLLALGTEFDVFEGVKAEDDSAEED